MVRSTSDTSS